MKARFEGQPLRTLEGEYIITLRTREDVRSTWQTLHDADVDVSIKKHRERRSIDANAYAWVLMDKLAAAVGRPKMDIYKDAVLEVGGNTDIVCVQDRAVDKLRESWSKNGAGWLTETMPSKIEGCTNVILYYGSSSFDTAQMSRMIDNLVQDCTAVGIETMPPYKLAALVEAWT